LKKLTQVDCPWNIQDFGGNLSYLSVYQARPVDYPSASCFPAGHASSGYAWFGVYYLLKKHVPKYRYYGLGGVISAGAILGITQQVRGAHFLSHDIWTLAICWSIATVLAPIILKERSLYNARFSG
jgi:membrane-associated PAP2 superfamily phosphatase